MTPFFQQRKIRDDHRMDMTVQRHDANFRNRLTVLAIPVLDARQRSDICTAPNVSTCGWISHNRLMGVLRIGHRGAAGHAPGNTLIAIAAALRIGVDLVEVDVQRTRDDHLIVLHDRFLQPSTTGRGAVSGCSLEEIRALRTVPGDLPIPTLAEVLEAVQGHAGLMLEIKSPGIAGAIVNAVRERGFRGPVYYASFLHEDIRGIREGDPSARTIALLEGVPIQPAAFAVDAEATHAGIAFECLSAAFVQSLHDAGLQVFVYTVDDPQQIAFARACGVDGIISNYPDRLL